MTALLAQSSRYFWMPDVASSYADDVDWVFKFIYWICVVMLVLIVSLMILFVWRFRKRPGREVGKAHPKSLSLELTWTIIPTIIVIVIFYFGMKGYLDMATPPPNAYEINVTAYKWAWAFTYPNGYVDQDLHVPKDRPIRLILSSQDVIHSLFIPNFRIKRDAVPGRYNKMWFQATEEGEFPLFCAEYCGTKHSDMVAKVVVHDATKFASWLEKASAWAETMPPVDAGKKLYTARGCSQCHSVDGTAAIGPSFKNIFGEEQMLADGSKIEVDENYIRNSILNPGDQIAAGYENVMPTYQGRLKDVEITALIEYIKSLSEHYEPPSATEEGEAEGEEEEGGAKDEAEPAAEETTATEDDQTEEGK